MIGGAKLIKMGGAKRCPSLSQFFRTAETHGRLVVVSYIRRISKAVASIIEAKPLSIAYSTNSICLVDFAHKQKGQPH